MYQRIFGAILLAICVGLVVIAWGYQAPFSYEPVGPRAYPLLLLALIMGGALYLLLKPASIHAASPGGDDHVPLDRHILTKSASCIALLLVYAALFENLGFLISSTLFGFFIARLYGARWLQCAVTGVIASIGLYLLFDYALDVPLPRGVLEFLEI